MELRASRLAQVFVQGDNYQLVLDDNKLNLVSKFKTDELLFEHWNGSVTVQRGLLWGSLVFHDHHNQPKWRVFGLPWWKCKHTAEQLSQCHLEWKNNCIKRLEALLPDLEQKIDQLLSANQYIKHSMVTQLAQDLQQSFHQAEMSDSLARSLMPNRVEPILGWITQANEWASQFNQQWVAAEQLRWQEWFSSCESSPLNLSQQQAVLMNDDHNLLLAGAGSGKTSVLMARVGYLIKSGKAQASEIVLLAYGRQAAQEMSQRLITKLGEALGKKVKVTTFHQFALEVIREVEYHSPVISPLATDKEAKSIWLTEQLSEQWQNETAIKRWQKHHQQWPFAKLNADEVLLEQSANPLLHGWVFQQIEALNNQQASSKKETVSTLEQHGELVKLKSELNLIWPLYKAYLKALKQNRAFDFTSMINKAIDYLDQGKYTANYRYVMVDEYQDISPQRLQLLESLCQVTSASLFAVGDDWQAIYRFTGADVNLTTGFEQRFGACTVNFLDTTYRFNSQIGAVANRFIQQNPAQIKKSLNSIKQQKQKAVTVIHHAALAETLKTLHEKCKKGESVLLIGRNHYHRPEELLNWCSELPNLSLEFSTCHASKGREADYVVIVNLDKGQFPTFTRQVSLKEALLASEDTFADAEERRLFYVAMTRAKKRVWLTTVKEPSPFINELKEEGYPIIYKLKKQ
ncbi:DNA helicase IV [Aliivibrio kagoshimensis]|uniref:DNA helicase IV n=1 Tax=Aliivibrio kagoshimensis TaxID=2910230 RepID=UPI003D0B0ADB